MESSSSRLSFLGFLLLLTVIIDISTAGNSPIVLQLSTIPVPLQTGEGPKSNKPGPLDGYGADYQWLVSTYVGTPKQLSKQLLDTGSSNFFITTTRCVGACLQFFEGSNLVATSSSSSFYERAGAYLYHYGGGAAFLYDVGNDIVVLDDSSSRFNQSLLSTTYNINGGIIRFDGVMGMGLDTITKPRGMTTLELLKNQNLISEQLFSVELRSQRDGGGGELIIGGYDQTKIKGDITWTPVTSVGYWEAKVGDIKVGSNDLKIGAKFVFDTGSEFIFAPCQIVTPIYDALPGSVLQPNGNWTIPCKLVETKSDYCDVSFQINGKWFTIPILDFIVDYHVDINGQRTDYCVGAVQYNPTYVVMGVPFFKVVNVYFDQDRRNIGVAQRNNNYK